MAYPRWLAKINRRVFNPIEVRRGKRPVVVHVGRTSGATYRTPVDAHPTRGGHVVVVRYGPQSDWVRNVLAEGGGTLRLHGEDVPFTSPVLATQAEAVAALPDGYQPRRDFFLAEHYLLVERAGSVSPDRSVAGTPG